MTRRSAVVHGALGVAGCAVLAAVATALLSRDPEDPSGRAISLAGDSDAVDGEHSTVPTAHEHTFAVPKGLKISGRVVSAPGTAVYGARVAASDGGPTTRTDTSGQFEIDCDRIPAALVVASRGYNPMHVDIPSDARKVYDCGDIVLDGEGALIVEIRGSDGNVLPGVNVDWTEARSAAASLNVRLNPMISEACWVHAGKTGANGQLLLSELPLETQLLVRGTFEGSAPVVHGPVRSGARAEPYHVYILYPPVHRLRIEAFYPNGVPVRGPIRIAKTDGPLSCRWAREYDQEEGYMDTALVEGAYDISLLAEGRRLYKKEVYIEGATVVSFAPAARVVLDLEVVDAHERPVESFDAVLFAGSAEPRRFEEHQLFMKGNAQRGASGHMRLVVPFERRGDAGAGELVVLVKAPGFTIRRSVLTWPENEDEIRHRVVLEQGVVIHEQASALPTGSVVKCYLMRTAQGAGWAAATAPLIDEATVAADGSWTIRGLGPGRYQLRVQVGQVELPLGVLDATNAGTYQFESNYAPAGVEVLFESGAGEGPPPVLIPLLSDTGWHAGREELYGDPLMGQADGKRLVFSPLAPGEYVVDDGGSYVSRVWGRSRDAIEIILSAGETRVLEWRRTGDTGRAEFKIQVPPASAASDVWLYAVVPYGVAPVYAASLAWQDLNAGGAAHVEAPSGAPFAMVVAVVPGKASVDRQFGTVYPIHIERVGSVEALQGAVIDVQEPATLHVDADGQPRIELYHEQWEDLLREPIVLYPGAPDPPMPSGSCRIVVRYLGRPGVPEKSMEMKATLVNGSKTVVGAPPDDR